jgi:hypothetical protein
MPIGLIIYLIVSSVLFVLAINLRLIPGNWFYEEFDQSGDGLFIFISAIMWPIVLVAFIILILIEIISLPGKFISRRIQKELDFKSNEQIK